MILRKQIPESLLLLLDSDLLDMAKALKEKHGKLSCAFLMRKFKINHEMAIKVMEYFDGMDKVQ